jgi:hypothetical protein
MLNDITFIKQDGSLGGVLPNEDHISALVFLYEYTGDFAPLIGYDFGEVTSISDAESKGITTEDYPLEHYHVAEFFRISPNARLFVGYEQKTNVASYTFESLVAIQNLSEGKIKQFGIIDTLSVYTQGNLVSIQSILEQLEDEHKPTIAIYGADLNGQDITGLADLRTETSPYVSVIISQSATGVGADLYDTLGISIPAVGACLGMIAKSAIHENIGWIEKFRVDGGGELTEVNFCTGDEYKDVAVSTLEALNDKGYIFLRHHVGIAGTYFNDSHTATAITSDYAYIERNRTINKAIRNMRTVMLPKLNSPLVINPADGTLAVDTIKYFENLAGKPLEQMQKDGELSGFKVYIDPAQDILTTSELVITVQLVIVGVARTITVNVAFAKSV